MPVDVWSLEGIRGHLASLEASANGPARIIHVSHEGSEVCTMFTLGPGEQRPQFYPEDVPFLQEFGSVVAWDKDGGLKVIWSTRRTEAQKTEFKEWMAKVDFSAMPEELRTLGEQMQGKTKEEMKQLMRDSLGNLPESVTDWSKQLFGGALSAGPPDYLDTGLADIVSFHEEAGWTAERREGTEGPFKGSRCGGDRSNVRRWRYPSWVLADST